MAFDSRRRRDYSPSSRSPAPSSGSLSSRFSSIAAQRVSNSPRPSSSNSRRPGREVHGVVQKASGQQRRSHHRNDRRMEIDTIGDDSGKRNNRNNSNNRNRNNTSRPQDSKNRNNSRSRSGRPGRRDEKKPLSQTDLDNDLEAYMMKNATTAQATLDMDIDSYMAAAPSKN